MYSNTVLTISPTKGVRVYKSERALSRVLSGNGTDSLHSTINRRATAGGGFVGDTWVQYTNYPSSKSSKETI